MQIEGIRTKQITNGTLSKYKEKRRRGKTASRAQKQKRKTSHYISYRISLVDDRNTENKKKRKEKKRTTKLLSFSRRRNLRRTREKNRQAANWESTFNDRRSSRWSSFVSNETKPFDTEWSSHVISSLYDVH